MTAVMLTDSIHPQSAFTGSTLTDEHGLYSSSAQGRRVVEHNLKDGFFFIIKASLKAPNTPH